MLPFQSKWGVAQKNSGNKPRLFAEVLSQFERASVEAAQELQKQLASNRGKPSGSGSDISGAVQPASSEQPARPSSELRQQSGRNLGKPSGSGTVSAEQPACSSSEQPVTLNSVHDVLRWLSSEEVASSNLNAGPVREAVAALTRTPVRDKLTCYLFRANGA